MPRKPKRPWNADLKMPGLLDVPPTVPKPSSDAVTVGHSTPGAPAEQWECLRCEQIRDGIKPTVPGHALRCAYRSAGRDPDPKG